MIHLITGLPGNGKTLYALAWVKAKAEKEGRPVFYARIADLTLPWTQIDPFEWHRCPPSSIIVIDECQKSNDPTDPKAPTLFGIRPRGAPVPEWVAALETHRHMGVDLVLVTQHPMLIDSHVRRLCGLHFHVVRKFGLASAVVHEFGSVREQVDKNRADSTRHDFKYPKEAYTWYKSAEVHTHKMRIPARVWWIGVMVLVIAGALYWVAASWASRIDGTHDSPLAQSVLPQGLPKPGQLVPGISGPGVGANGGQVVSTSDYLRAHTPRVSGLAYTAPAYDEVTKPVEAPHPAACIASYSRCQCYTTQATRLDMPEALCRQIARDGFFVAWRQADVGRPQERSEPARSQAAGAPAPAVAPPPVLPSSSVPDAADM